MMCFDIKLEILCQQNVFSLHITHVMSMYQGSLKVNNVHGDKLNTVCVMSFVTDTDCQNNIC